MSRPVRIEFKDAVYHVMNRGLNHNKIFHNDSCYQAFLQCVIEAHQRFELKIFAYCVMGNHYHLLVKTPLGNLSRCMRHINGVYTQRYHKITGGDGPIFRGRYKAILVDVDSYLLQVSRYIHRNPIETHPPLVARLQDYQWSSYPCYISTSNTPQWLDMFPVVSLLAEKHNPSIYKAYTESDSDNDINAFYERPYLKSILGSNEFKKNIIKNKKWNLHPEVPTKCLTGKIGVSSVIDFVKKQYGCSESSILFSAKTGRKLNKARVMAIYLSHQLCQLRLIDLAKIYNVKHYSAISHSIKKMTELRDAKSLRKLEKDCIANCG